MAEQRLILDSPEAVELAGQLCASLEPVCANGSLPDGLAGSPHVIVFGTDAEWVHSIEALLRTSGSPIVRPGVGNFMEVDRANPFSWLRARVAGQPGTQNNAHSISDAAKELQGVSSESADVQGRRDEYVQSGGGKKDARARKDISRNEPKDAGHDNPDGAPSDGGGYDDGLRDQGIGFSRISESDENEAVEHALRSMRTASALKSAAHEEGPQEWGEPADFWSANRPIPFNPQWISPTVRPFVLNQAAMVGCDPGITWLQTLGFAAGCLSDEIRVRVRPLQDWAESARIWACIVGEPGDGKSPSMQGIMRESRELNREIAERSKRAQAGYKDEFDLYELERKAWLNKRQKNEPAGERPFAPAKPVNEMLYFNSTTSEGLLEQQEATTRGTMLYADEMLGWIFGMDQYKASGKGNDKQFWLSSWDGAEFIGVLVGKLRTIPNTGVTIIGGSQPSAIRRATTKLNLEADGLLQRVLVYNSQGDANEDAEQPLDRDAALRWRAILHRLYNMKGARDS